MKKSISFIMALILMMSIAACGSHDTSAEATTEHSTAPTEPSTVPTTEPFNIEDYKSLVSNCVTEIYDGSVVLSNIISFEYKYLKAYKNIAGSSAEPDSEMVVETGIKGIEENSEHTEESVKENYNDISTMYKDIVILDTGNAEAIEIMAAFKEMHEAYVGLYNLAFSPDLDMSALASSHDEYIKTIKNSKSVLDILLS